jgi:hypothetical protein
LQKQIIWPYFQFTMLNWLIYYSSIVILYSNSFGRIMVSFIWLWKYYGVLGSQMYTQIGVCSTLHQRMVPFLQASVFWREHRMLL